MPSGVYQRTEAHLAQLAQFRGQRSGSKQSPETVELMRQNAREWWAKPENRAKRTGQKHTDEHRENQRQAKLRNPVRYWQGKKRPSPSVETRAKMSVAKKGRPKPESFSPHIKRPAHYNGQVFRSTYEVRVAKALDALGVPWVYEPKRFDLGTCRYKPDFFLPDDGVFWEVKGWFSPTSQYKVAAFRATYPQTPLVVFTKDCIEILECAVEKGRVEKPA